MSAPNRHIFLVCICADVLLLILKSFGRHHGAVLGPLRFSAFYFLLLRLCQVFMYIDQMVHEDKSDGVRFTLKGLKLAWLTLEQYGVGQVTMARLLSLS